VIIVILLRRLRLVRALHSAPVHPWGCQALSDASRPTTDPGLRLGNFRECATPLHTRTPAMLGWN